MDPSNQRELQNDGATSQCRLPKCRVKKVQKRAAVEWGSNKVVAIILTVNTLNFDISEVDILT
jgi:hypothetical protein